METPFLLEDLVLAMAGGDMDDVVFMTAETEPDESDARWVRLVDCTDDGIVTKAETNDSDVANLMIEAYVRALELGTIVSEWVH
jgi:hypothetical protein